MRLILKFEFAHSQE